jgi:cytochrome P450
MNAIRAGIDPVKYFREHATDREMFCLNFPGLGRVRFVSGPAGARDILTAPAAATLAPRPNPIEPVVGPGSLILLSGQQHRRERGRLITPFHGDRVKSFAGLFAETTCREIDGFRPGQRIGLRALCTAITLGVAVRVVCGITEPDRRRRYADAVSELLAANTAALMLVPVLRRELGGRGPWARLMALRDDLDRLLAEELAGRRSLGAGGDDILDILLSATDEEGHTYADAELCDQLRTLLAAGHETTATALTWALYRIYADDGIRSRLETEIRCVTTASEMTKLPYLDAVIKETLRMHPPVPIVLRRLAEPLNILGISCPAGTVVGIALYALHNNPDIWDRPDRFDPNRFLHSRYSAFEYAPFGGGHRRCLGASFATAELAVVIATVMRGLDLRLSPAEATRKPPGSSARGIAVTLDREIFVDVAARN